MKHRLPLVILPILLCFATGFSQIVADRGNFGLHTFDDSILQYKYLERENQLMIVGWKNIQLLDRNLQIYETESGKLKVELTNVELPSWGWLDSETLANVDYKQKNFFEQGPMLKAFDANDGRLLFKRRLEYAEREVTPNYNPDVANTEVYDSTTLRPHPARKIFMTSSNQFVKRFDSRTGDLLQT